MTSVIRVAIAGPRGRMGQEAVQAVANSPDMALVACLDRPDAAIDSPMMVQATPVPVYTDAATCFLAAAPDVVVDLTHAQAAVTTLDAATTAGVRLVIGTTGLSEEFLGHLDRSLKERQIGGLLAPNFAIGALLMMRASELASRFMPDVEIIEYHHPNKRDAPSGTAQKTARRIQQIQAEQGIEHRDIPIHSVRLSGFVAHQEVIFGGADERLTIRHDSMSRKSFMPGILLGIRSVMHITGLVDGLEHFLW